ncbi:Major facilitator protein [Hibiscus syriacus]|uniref:Major facilitator protein n=1 Tax=Hibiscus syriacus TaxID=106335 RepID=A0A6A2YCP1_HIBSY|nr:Major facilitator protein [Hibiscus syriacus]
MNFEYSRVYVNMNLTCWKCRTPFFAAETSTPSINGNSKYTPLSNFMQQQKFHQVQNSGRGRFSGLGASKKFSQAGAFAGSASNINVAPPSSFATRAAGATHSASKTLKRRHKESKAGTRTGESLQIRVPSHKTHAGLGTRSSGSVSRTAAKKPRSKKRHTGTTEIENPIAMGNEGASLSSIQKNGSNIRRTDASGISSNSIKEPPRLGIRNMLMEMARREICKNTNSWTPALPNASNKPKVSDEELEEQNEGNRKDAPSKKPGAKKSTEFVDIKSSMQTKMSSVADSDVDPATRGPEPVSMSVPDPDFHDFDQDRMEKSFGENQVWAAYDDDDGMPRYYAMIHSVISLKPFKMRMSWLNSKSNAELGPLNWIGSGFFKTSGEFWIGKYGVNRSLNSFSHKVKWSKGRKGVIQIYPRKGDVWALYRNWSSDWNSLTPSEVIHNYDMVEVLEDYNEQNGVAISPLVKVPGFKTVFRKHSKPSKPWVIPREELFRFSHQVPSYLLTGQEGQKSCEGRLELDPAATPLELLQVFTEDQVKEMETMIERAREDALNVDSKRSKGKELVEDDQETKPKITDEGVGQAKETENKKAGLLVYVRRHPKKSDS